MLFLRFSLAGPLQSWGPPSPWDVKTTYMMPTKSGIVGLISACFGYRRGDPRIQELSDGLSMAVRADRPGSLIEDFQSIHSNKPYMVSASGTKRTSSAGAATSIVVRKHYIQDARFTVFLSGKEELLRNICKAMKAPVFLTYLGRKTCVPTEPIIPELVEAQNIYEVLRMFSDNDKREIGENRRVLIEVDAPSSMRISLAKRIFIKRDCIVNGCGKNNYATRKVATYYVDM